MASAGTYPGDESAAFTHKRVITAATGSGLPSLRELWQSRDLIYLLMRRDVAVRYKQSLVGAGWAVLQPLLFAAVFSVFLGTYAKVPSGDGVPYPLFALSGLVLWLYFGGSLLHISQSAVANSGLITKVYFPRLIIPLSATAQPLLDFVIAFSVVIPIAFAYGITPSPRVFMLPLLIVLTWFLVLGAGFWLSALNVKFRDVGFVVPFMIQIGLFMTPIVYPFDVVPEGVQTIYALNPMVGVLETYRWLLFPGADAPGMLLLVPIVAAVVLFITGAWYFQRAERDFADII